jgi:hypothetical protein
MKPARPLPIDKLRQLLAWKLPDPSSIRSP